MHSLHKKYLIVFLVGGFLDFLTLYSVVCLHFLICIHNSSRKKRMAMFLSWPFGSRRKYLNNTWIAMKFWTDIHGSQRMNTTDFGEPLSPWGWHFCFLAKDLNNNLMDCYEIWFRYLGCPEDEPYWLWSLCFYFQLYFRHKVHINIKIIENKVVDSRIFHLI